MTIILNYFAYMALAYEGCLAVLTILKMSNFFKIMKFDMEDGMVQLEGVCKLICFGILAFGVITRYRSMVKVWLLLSYCQINWAGVIKVFVNIYEYFFAEKNKDKAEFMKELSEAHAPLVGRVMAQIGIILIIYRFYETLEPPTKIRGPLTKMSVEEKVE
ncbi:uncharacterized protein LOC117787663 [Drosophila innubila]|uniref:uncharacterized protein LOC117787663 n=1 Tax=Drosophila innubila TaxID=198719 RepID=UPI00148C4D19|nr:uncharacterized protein LOC117787663 [Drosophila innubila]